MSLALALALAGLGLVLFGLRVFLQALDETVVARIRPMLTRWTRGRLRSFLGGFGLTIGLQASALTVIGAMGLVQGGLLGLEPALFVILGATVGTTAKAWLPVLTFDVLGPLLLGGASVALVFARRYARRRMLEVACALGLMFLGWHLLGTSLGPLLETASARAWLAWFEVASPSGLFLTLLGGALVTAAVGSSSTVVFLVIGLAAEGALSLPVGAALILGANVGTAAVPLFASLEYRPEVRRLAQAHLLIKGVGVVLAALFFHAFLSSIGVVVALAGADGAAVSLAAVHTGFNVANACLWSLFAPRLARRIEDARNSVPLNATFLAAPVRRLLANVPDEALTQLEAERDRVLRELKVTEDRLLRVLARGDDELPPRSDLLQRVQAGQELLVQVAASHPWSPRLQTLTHQLQAVEDVIKANASLVQGLQLESRSYRQRRADRLAPVFARFQAVFDELWSGILTGQRVPAPGASLDACEAEAYRLLREGERVREQELFLLTRQLRPLRRIALRLRELAREAHLSSSQEEPALAEPPAPEDPAPPESERVEDAVEQVEPVGPSRV